MKKILLILLIPALLVCLTACEINWFGETIDVPWYYVAIPVAIISVAGYFILMSSTFICPNCKTEFKPKPHQLYVALHCGNKRFAKCPNCKRRGYFPKKPKDSFYR